MVKKRVFSEDQIQKIISMYAQGEPLKKIGREFNTSYKIIKKLLDKFGVFKPQHKQILYRKRCDICKKPFWAYDYRRKYCYNPCNSNYKVGNKSYYKSLNYHYLRVLRTQIWRMVKSNPTQVLDLKEEIIEEEGEEFADLVFGNILESKEFKKLMGLYKKYECVFNEESE